MLFLLYQESWLLAKGYPTLITFSGFSLYHFSDEEEVLITDTKFSHFSYIPRAFLQCDFSEDWVEYFSHSLSLHFLCWLSSLIYNEDCTLDERLPIEYIFQEFLSCVSSLMFVKVGILQRNLQVFTVFIGFSLSLLYCEIYFWLKVFPYSLHSYV